MTTSLHAPARRLSAWALPGLWLALTIALFVAFKDVPWARSIEHVRGVRLLWIGAALLANTLIFPLWTAEWRLLVPNAVRVAYATMWEVVSISAAVLNSIPFFAGEVSAVALLIARAGLARSAAVTVLALDQLLVGFAKLAVLGAAALYAPLPTWLRTGVLSLVAGVAVLLLVLQALAHRWTAIRQALIAQPSALRRLATRVVEWGAHLDALRDVKRTAGVASLALAKKAVELLAILAVQAAFGLEPSVAGALLVLAALSITTLVPVAPANLGVYEATVFGAYRYLGVSQETALGLAVVQHLCFLVPSLGLGYLTLTLRHLRLPRAS